MDKKGSLTVEMSYDFGLLVMFISYMRVYLNSGHNTNPV